ncbi:hypothetical protein ACLOJK_017579, partial [Asimina triloba]
TSTAGDHLPTISGARRRDSGSDSDGRRTIRLQLHLRPRSRARPTPLHRLLRPDPDAGDGSKRIMSDSSRRAAPSSPTTIDVVAHRHRQHPRLQQLTAHDPVPAIRFKLHPIQRSSDPPSFASTAPPPANAMSARSSVAAHHPISSPADGHTPLPAVRLQPPRSSIRSPRPCLHPPITTSRRSIQQTTAH